MAPRALTVGLVANEPSGDILGAALAAEIRSLVPDVRLIGVAGPRMLAAGCETLFPMERLSVMGLTEVLGHLPELLRLRHRLARHFLDNPPAVFVGVDAPDFNLGLERRLREAGIRTAHLVSPTVWAWRPGRVKGIRRAVDLMLCVFPFEEPFLRQHGVSARFVGHPLADQIPLQPDRAAARAGLGLEPEETVVAVLPGSRAAEVARLAAPFIQTAVLCHQARSDLRFVVPLVNARVGRIFERELSRLAPNLPLSRIEGRSREAIEAADCVLTASGTATFECLLLKRPMVVGYRVHPLTYRLARYLVKVPYAAMANLLAGQELAPEFLQDRCRAELMAPALLAFLDDVRRVSAIQDEYSRIHSGMRHNAAQEAARAVLALADPGGGWAEPLPASSPRPESVLSPRESNPC